MNDNDLSDKQHANSDAWIIKLGASPDISGPVIEVKSASGKRGAAIMLQYRITDDSSETVGNVVFTIRNAKGAVVKSIPLKAVKMYT